MLCLCFNVISILSPSEVKSLSSFILYLFLLSFLMSLLSLSLTWLSLLHSPHHHLFLSFLLTFPKANSEEIEKEKKKTERENEIVMIIIAFQFEW